MFLFIESLQKEYGVVFTTSPILQVGKLRHMAGNKNES